MLRSDIVNQKQNFLLSLKLALEFISAHYKQPLPFDKKYHMGQVYAMDILKGIVLAIIFILTVFRVLK